jgi:hypothetical protein
LLLLLQAQPCLLRPVLPLQHLLQQHHPRWLPLLRSQLHLAQQLLFQVVMARQQQLPGLLHRPLHHFLHAVHQLLLVWVRLRLLPVLCLVQLP